MAQEFQKEFPSGIATCTACRLEITPNQPYAKPEYMTQRLHIACARCYQRPFKEARQRAYHASERAKFSLKMAERIERDVQEELDAIRATAESHG